MIIIDCVDSESVSFSMEIIWIGKKYSDVRNV